MILLAVPLILVSLFMTVVGFTGVALLPVSVQAALPAAYLRAGLSALLAVALAMPAASRRISIAWVLPLAILPGAGAAGWSILPLPAFPGTDILEGAVLLLPSSVLVLRQAWRSMPPGLADTARALGATRWQTAWLGIVSPALGGIGLSFLVAFVLALGLAPLLAPPAAAP